jgi:hypothetical protein
MKALPIFLALVLTSCFVYKPIQHQANNQTYTSLDFLPNKVYRVKLSKFKQPLLVQIKNVTDSSLVVIPVENMVIRNNAIVFLTSIEDAQLREFSFVKSALFYVGASIPVGLIMLNANYMP